MASVFLKARFLNTTWVQCDDCGKWRHLGDVHDPSSLPDRWVCQLNHDDARNSCDKDEEDDKNFVDTEFGVGSLVWARQNGHFWWPAMVHPNGPSEAWFSLDQEGKLSEYFVRFFGWNGESAWVDARRVKAFTKWSPKTCARQDVFVKKTCQGWNGKKLQLAREEIEQAAAIADVQERLRMFGKKEELVGGESAKRWAMAQKQLTMEEMASSSGTSLLDSAPRTKRKKQKRSTETPDCKERKKNKLRIKIRFQDEIEKSSCSKDQKSFAKWQVQSCNVANGPIGRSSWSEETADECAASAIQSLPNVSPSGQLVPDDEFDLGLEELEEVRAEYEKDDAMLWPQELMGKKEAVRPQMKPLVASDGTPLALLQIQLRPELSMAAQMKKLQTLTAKLDDTAESRSAPTQSDKATVLKPHFGKKLNP